jgi:hypothetical protein
MALIQSQAKAPGTGGRVQFVGPALTIAAVIVAAAIVAMLASSFTAKPNGGTVVNSQGDSLVGPKAVEFRALEHAASLALGDPLVGPNAIEFRAGEHGTTGPAQVRAGEHPAGVTAGDRLLKSGAGQFPASGHGR